MADLDYSIGLRRIWDLAAVETLHARMARIGLEQWLYASFKLAKVAGLLGDAFPVSADEQARLSQFAQPSRLRRGGDWR